MIKGILRELRPVWLVLVISIFFSNGVFSDNLTISVSASGSGKLIDGGVYYIKNLGTGKYLNVHNGIDANTTNVYQWSKDGKPEQQFRLERVTAKGVNVYRVRAMCSSNGTNRVLDIVKSGGVVKDGCNVEIYNATDPTAQEWDILTMDNRISISLPRAVRKHLG